MKKGYTLAEVLIIIGIIGVVAALVLPFLKISIDAKIYKTRFKKHISEIQSALLLMKANGEYINVFSYSNVSDYNSNFNSKFKHVIICNDVDDDNSECGSKILHVNELSGRSNFGYQYSGSVITENFDRILFPDGALLAVIKYSGYGYAETHMLLDINGWLNGPNRAGYDVFHLRVDDEYGNIVGPFTPSSNISQNQNIKSIACDNSGTYGCTYKALTEDNYFENIMKTVKLH